MIPSTTKEHTLNIETLDKLIDNLTPDTCIDLENNVPCCGNTGGCCIYKYVTCTDFGKYSVCFEHAVEAYTSKEDLYKGCGIDPEHFPLCPKWQCGGDEEIISQFIAITTHETNAMFGVERDRLEDLED